MKPLPRFDNSLAHLDAALTRKSWRDVHHTATAQQPTPEKLVYGELYYLSDGGYSRVWWDGEARHLCLASESSPGVKDGWKNCKELIEDIERDIEDDIARQLQALEAIKP